MDLVEAHGEVFVGGGLHFAKHNRVVITETEIEYRKYRFFWMMAVVFYILLGFAL